MILQLLHQGFSCTVVGNTLIIVPITASTAQFFIKELSLLTPKAEL